MPKKYEVQKKPRVYTELLRKAWKHIPETHLQPAASILYSGNAYASIKELMDILHLKMFESQGLI